MAVVALAHPQTRRRLCAALPLLALPLLRVAQAMPLQNLLIEVRVADSASVTQDAAVSGSVGVDSRGNVRAAGQVSALGSTQRQGQSVQSVRVLNGGQARLKMVQTQALLGAVAAWGGQRAVPLPVPDLRERDADPQPWRDRGLRPPPPHGTERGGAVVTTWAELVDGFDVRPRWPGGSSPVTLEIGAMRSLGTPQGHAPPPQFSLFTTVLVPLGEWADVAELRQAGSATANFGAGTVGTQRALRLQARISAA